MKNKSSMPACSLFICSLFLGVLVSTAQAPPTVALGIERDGADRVRLRWNMSSGAAYTLEIKKDLTSDWEAVTELIQGTIGEHNQAVAIGTGTQFFRLRITASDSHPDGMVLVPAGSFEMGDWFHEHTDRHRPVHTVYISAFNMDRFQVTKALWDEVYEWAVSRPTSMRYDFDRPGRGKGPDHPVYHVNWYDAVKWCNARSEKEGILPAYYTESHHNTVYRSGRLELLNDWVKWNAGYRLPTEAEWEKAARGGLTGRRFPWGNFITHAHANYHSLLADFKPMPYDISRTREYHPTFNDGVLPYTSPVGYFAPNGYGLHDMAGNVEEWCWDQMSPTYYAWSPTHDPRGPPTPAVADPGRIIRGGAWYDWADSCTTATRIHALPSFAGYPVHTEIGLGFRCVRGTEQQ